MNYEDTLVEEVKTWLMEDTAKREEKIQRETIRHHKLKKDLLLDQLNTSVMDVVEIGGGPVPVSDLIPFHWRIVIDPNSNEYSKYFPCRDHFNRHAEELNSYIWHDIADLVICTNALDHVEWPARVARNIKKICRPGGYVAIVCAENNAITNPHPCHVHNLTVSDIHSWFDKDFETVWELTYQKDNYRYGWVEYQGKRGQPAFAILLRRCSGYR